MSRTTMHEDCPICIAPAEQPLRAACGHTFCKSCIETWGLRSPKCPMCRRTMAEDKTKIKGLFCNLLAFFYAFFVISLMTSVLETICVTEFTGRNEAQMSIFVSYAIYVLLMHLAINHTKDFVSRIHAQQRGLTVARLEWIYLVFICTGLAICLVPSFAYWWSATAVIGLVLILPRAWDVCICFIALLLCVSCALPLMLKFTAETVLSVLTEVPVLRATSILPLLADVIVTTVSVFMVYAVHKCNHWLMIYFGFNILGVDCLGPRMILRNIEDRVYIWGC